MKVRNLCLVIALSLLLPARSEAGWRGKIVEVDGVPHVLNPETPASVVRVELQPLWERGGEDDDLFFGRLGQLVQDDEGELFVLDSQLSEIYVFSQGGELLRTIGREGEGPGEFMQVMDMYLGPDGLLGLVRIFPGRVYRIGRDGSPADHFPLPNPGGFQLVHVGRANGDRVVIASAEQTRVDGRQIAHSYLKAYDEAGNELVKYCETSEATQFGGMRFDEKIFSDFMRRWAMAADGRIAVAMDFDDYRFDVYNADGTLQRVIERPGFELLPRTGEQKERMQKFYDGITRWNPNSTFKVSETHQSVSGVWYRENGNLWVLSSRGSWGRAEGVFASIDEYDGEGRYQRRIDIVCDGDSVEDGLFVFGDRVYRVTDLFGSIMASLGGDEQTDEALASDPLRLVAYEMSLPD